MYLFSESWAIHQRKVMGRLLLAALCQASSGTGEAHGARRTVRRACPVSCPRALTIRAQVSMSRVFSVQEFDIHPHFLFVFFVFTWKG